MKVVEGIFYIDNSGNIVFGIFCGLILLGVIRLKYLIMYINFEIDRVGMYRGFYVSFIIFFDRKCLLCIRYFLFLLVKYFFLCIINYVIEYRW